MFEIEGDSSIVEVFTHLKALYEEQWGDAEATAPPEEPGQVDEDMSTEKPVATSAKIEPAETAEVIN